MSAAFKVDTVVVGRWRVNCYLVHDGTTGFLIDPGDEPDLIRARVAAAGFRPLAILNTHAHFDHVGAVAPLKREYGIPFFLHASDRRLLTHANLYRALAGDNRVTETPTVDQPLDPGLPVRLGDWTVRVLHTPGHTAGSVCLLVGDCIFSGDTLFADGAGRTDLPGASSAALAASLDCLRCQPDASAIYPGHGASASLADALASVGATASQA